MLNGDETYHNSRLRVLGRNFQSEEKKSIKESYSNDPFVYSPATKQYISTPGIYKVIVYQR